MKKLLSLLISAGLTCAAFAAEVYGPAKPVLLSNLSIPAITTSNVTSITPPFQLGYNVPYVTFAFHQQATNATVSNVVYTVSGTIGTTNRVGGTQVISTNYDGRITTNIVGGLGPIYVPITNYSLALNGTNLVSGYLILPQSVYGSFKSLALTAVQTYTNGVTVSATAGFWHQTP